MRNFIVLFLALLQASVLAYSIPTSDIVVREPTPEVEVDVRELTTNAARMAHGLGPLKPRHLSRVQARTPPKPKTSPCPPTPPPPPPPTCKTGSIVIKKCNNAKVGYLKRHTNFGVSNSEKLAISFEPKNGPFDIEIKSYGFNYKYLGIHASDNNGDFQGNDKYLFTSTQSTPSNDGPKDVSHSLRAGSQKYAESSVWSFNSGSKELKPTWRNKSGNSVSSPAAKVWHYSDGSLGIIRANYNPNNGYEVKLYYEQ